MPCFESLATLRRMDGPGVRVRAFGREIARAWLLVGYVLVTFIGGLVQHLRPTWLHLANYLVYLPLYLALIWWWTRKDAPLSPSEIGRPARWREILALATPWVVLVGLIAWTLVVRARPADPVSLASTPNPVAAATTSTGHLLQLRLGNAAMSTLKLTLPALALCAIAKMSWRRIGFAPRYLGLAAVLVGIGIANALALSATVGLQLSALPLFALPAIVVPYYAIQLLINALPEELAARGLTLQRWLALTRSPGVAITVSTIWFVALHAPFRLLQDGNLSLGDALNWLFFGGQPTGVVWGYLFYRTRSLWPGILWHGSYTVLGTLFL